MIRDALLSCLLLLGGAAATAAPGIEGRYRLTGQPDIASELVLLPSGRFQYYLAAGALDERSEGRWSANGRQVVITTHPKPVPATFSVKKGLGGQAPLSLKVEWADGRGIAGVDLRLGFDSGAPIEGYTQEQGWTLPSDERRIPIWVEFAVPMHGLASQRFPIDGASSGNLVFTLTPNDLGTVDFDAVTLDITADVLVMHREGKRLSYVRVE